MSRLYLSMVDPCKKEVDDRQDGQIQRCAHGYVMAAQTRFQDLPLASPFHQAADSNPRWANAAVAQQAEADVEKMAMDKIMGGKLGKIIGGIVKAVESQEEVV